MSDKLLHERLREWASNRPFRFNEAWEEFVRLDEALDGLLGMLAEPFVLIAKWLIGKIGR